MFTNLKNFFNEAQKKDPNKIEYLDNDIYAVLSLLIEASKIDGKIDLDEIGLIKELLIKKFHLNHSKATMAINHVIKESDNKVEIYSDIKVILDNMDHEQRITVIEMLWSVIIADDKVDEYESNLLRRICGLLHISGKESSEAKRKVSGK